MLCCRFVLTTVYTARSYNYLSSLISCADSSAEEMTRCYSIGCVCVCVWSVCHLVNICNTVAACVAGGIMDACTRIHNYQGTHTNRTSVCSYRNRNRNQNWMWSPTNKQTQRRAWPITNTFSEWCRDEMSRGLVSRDSIVDDDWLSETE